MGIRSSEDLSEQAGQVLPAVQRTRIVSTHDEEFMIQY
jgi:hypothetical protein